MLLAYSAPKSSVVKPELTDIVIGLIDGQLAGADGVEGGWVGLVLEVGAVGVGALAATTGNCKQLQIRLRLSYGEIITPIKQIV